MTISCFYGGIREISENKILLEDHDTRVDLKGGKVTAIMAWLFLTAIID